MRRKMFAAAIATSGVFLVVAPASAVDPVGSAFTYQGQLRDAGAPADGKYDFVFRLFDADSGGAQIGADFPVDDWPVIGGLFTVELDFGASAFAGDERWLEIAVRPGDSVDPHTILSPRQPLTAAPYALFSAAPWETGAGGISYAFGNVGVGTPASTSRLTSQGSGGQWAIEGVSDTGAGVFGSASASSGANFGVLGLTNSSAGRGVYGLAQATTGTNYGVYGETASTDGIGVFGIASATAGETYGGQFRSESTSGFGLYAHAAATSGFTYGVYAQSDSPTGVGLWGHGGVAGVYGRSAYSGVEGLSTGASDPASIGVLGQSQSTSGRGLAGIALATTGTNYGVFGQSYSPDGYAGYFAGGRNYLEGDVGIGEPDPLARLHVRNQDLSLDETALHLEDAVLEDQDAVLGLYSNSAGTRGSTISLAELDGAGALVDKWAILRNTSAAGSAFAIKYGTNANYSNNATMMVIDANGDVGVGTSSPAARLAVGGNGASGLSLNVTDNLYVDPDLDFVGVNRSTRVSTSEYFGIQAPATSGYGGMFISTAGANAYYGYDSGTSSAYTYLDEQTDDWHVFNDGVRLTVEDTGNVGIGTLNPVSLLDLQSTEEVRITLQADTDNSGETDNPSVVFTQDGGQVIGRVGYRYGENNFQVMQEYAGSLMLGTSDLVRMTINANGHVGIGETTPDYKLHVIAGDEAVFAENTAAYDGDTTGLLGMHYAGAYGIWKDGDSEDYAGGGLGWSLPRAGVYATSSSAAIDAAYLDGNVTVTGTLSKGGGSFKIDHPLDPENKYLYHSFVESPDMMNLYNGNVITDAEGLAVVTLPDWFEALNRDYRYQLAVIGQFAQAIVSEKVRDHRFTIRTDKPHVEVSWQVTGIRQDAYANASRIPVEEEKPPEQRGKYLHPEAFGKPCDLEINRFDPSLLRRESN